MGRLRGLVVAGCLLLAACSGERAGPRHAVIDYKDFIKLGGTMYYVADHGVGRSIERGDLGPVFAVVRGNPPRNDPTLTYRPRDGDAAYLPAGSPVHTVKSYRPSFRVAASHHSRLRLYEANEAVGARTGADLLDLAGKVRHLSVNSGRVELARIKDRGRVAELVQSVLEAPVGPSWSRAEARYCFVVFNMVDQTAVRRAFFPETGELMPGVFAPPAFSRAVESALRGRHERCGGSA
jgi:hypothetical protein